MSSVELSVIQKLELVSTDGASCFDGLLVDSAPVCTLNMGSFDEHSANTDADTSHLQQLRSAEAIYARYQVPRNLQDHMLATAAIAEIIEEWRYEPSGDGDRVVYSMLTHDLGNIVKYDLEKQQFWAPEDQAQPERIAQTKADFKRVFGDDPDVVTLAILRELSMDASIIELLARLQMSLLAEIVQTGTWAEKLQLYCDSRVTPFGVVGISERIEDVLRRYPQLREEIEAGRVWLEQLEGQIAQELCQHPADITHQMAQARFESLQRRPLPVMPSLPFTPLR